MNKKIIFVSMGVLLLFSSAALDAGEPSFLKLFEAVFKVPAPTGYEEPLIEVIKGLLPAGSPAMRDNLGSLYWKRENRRSQIAVCTPLDEVGYFVSGINSEGYLQLDKAVFGLPLIDSYHLGHPVMVWTRKGPIEGVLALPSLHILSSEVRQTFQERPSLELAYVDIGVNSAEGAREKGAAIMDAVTPWREITRLAGSKMAGYSLGIKLCTALVLDAAQQPASPQAAANPSFVWMAQTKLTLRRSRPPSALGGFRASEKMEAGRVVVVDCFPCDTQDSAGITIGNGPVLVCSGSKEATLVDKIQEWAHDKGVSVQAAPNHRSSVMLPFLSGREEVIGLFLPVKFSRTPSEVVDTRDAEALGSLLSMLLQEGGW
jgi:putative aminopeptidase FrvX